MIHDATAPELASVHAFAAFLHSFETAEVPLREWTHAAHVAMAGGYLQRMTKPEALEAIRAGILNLNRANAVPNSPDRGYHESLTRLWLHVCDAHLQETGFQGLEAIRSLVAVYGRRSDLYTEFYSFDPLRHRESRAAWIPPDRQPLPAAWRRDNLLVSTSKQRLHGETVCGFLNQAPRHAVFRAIANSLCFGLYEGGFQVGFARVVTDLATLARLVSLAVVDSHRGRGLDQWLAECVAAHPSLEGIEITGL